jgi:hypothetical protein
MKLKHTSLLLEVVLVILLFGCNYEENKSVCYDVR